MSESWTVWVCTNCLMHHANGESGDCHHEEGHEYEPLSKVSPARFSMGMASEDHSDSCEVRIKGECPTKHECDCDTDTFSTSWCDGCGRTYHGEPHSMTEWGE
jgi:hypothetical protein